MRPYMGNWKGHGTQRPIYDRIISAPGRTREQVKRRVDVTNGPREQVKRYLDVKEERDGVLCV